MTDPQSGGNLSNDDVRFEFADDLEPGSGYTPQETDAIFSVPLSAVQETSIVAAADGTESLYASANEEVEMTLEDDADELDFDVHDPGIIRISAEAYGSDRGLREYWTHGEGAAKIRWGTPGDFKRCVRHLRKYVTRPEGLCNEYHVEAVGAPPGKGHSVESESFAVEAVTPVQRVGTTNANSIGWEGTLAIEGEETGDGREFANGSLDWATPPLPLMWQVETSHGGQTDRSVNVGNITEVWRDGSKIMGRGTIDLDDEYGMQVARKMKNKYLNGVSIDADSVKDADVELVYAPAPADLSAEDSLLQMIGGQAPDKTIFHSGRVRGATLVNLPAFVGASLDLIGDTSMLDTPMVAAGNRHHDFVPGEHPRDMQGRFEDVPGLTKKGPLKKRELLDTEAGVSLHPDEEVDSLGDNGPDENDDAGITVDPSEYYKQKKKRKTVVSEDHDYSVITAAAQNGRKGYTIEIPELPPLEFFEEPTELPPIGAVWIEPNGHIWGLVGPSDVAHRAFRGKKVTIPMGNVDYTAWMNRPTPVEGPNGEVLKIRTGVITMNCGHLNPYASDDPAERMKHYDNSCSIAAVVRVGESKLHKAPWVSGTIMPMSVADFQRLQACQISGDWAPHRERRGWKEFVASLAVPVPGFARSTDVAAVRVDDNAVVVASAVPIKLSSDAYDDEDEVLTSAAYESNRLALGRIRAQLGSSNRQTLAAIRDRVNAGAQTLTASAATATPPKEKKKVGCTPCAAKRAGQGQTSANLEQPPIQQVPGYGDGDPVAQAAESQKNAIANTRATSRG